MEFDKILTEEFLIENYVNLKKTKAQIAREVNCSHNTIFDYFKKFNIQKVRRQRDLTNQIFSRWKVLRKTGFKHGGKDYYECMCDCGQIKEIEGSSLTSGLSKSCGCIKYNYKGYEELSGTYWRKIQKTAACRSLEFSITIEQAWDLFLKQDKKCALSKIPINLVKNHNRAFFQTASLDRIDSSKGYVLENVQWVHKRINLMKGSLNQEEFIWWCNIINKTNKVTKDFDHKDLNNVGRI